MDKGSIKDKLGVLFEKITKVIELYSPEVLSLEKLFFNKNAKTVLGVGEARGVIMVKSILGFSEIPKPDDAADALAIALTCAYTNKQMRKI